MIKLTFSVFSNQDTASIKIDFQGRHSSSTLPKSLCTKRQWNSKLTIGRRVQNYQGEKINFPKFNNSSTLSRKNTKIDLQRGFPSLNIPYKFIVYLLCLRKKDLYMPEDLLRIISRFYFKPRTYTCLSGLVLKNYIRVKDLNSASGTLVKISSSLLNSCEVYMIAENKLKIEKVKNEGILYEDGRFFRGIPMDHICVIHEEYMGNVYDDRSIQEGECGFPYVKCVFNGVKYFLVATEAKYRFFLGRFEFCDIFIDRNSISRMQCIIEYDFKNFRWILHDGNPDEKRKSLNGTFKILRGGSDGSGWAVAECNEIVVNNVRIQFS